MYPGGRMDGNRGPRYLRTMPTLHDRLVTLSAPVRVRLIRLLELEELTVGEIARVVQLPQSTVSRHLKDLHDDGWVERRRHGTATFFAVRRDLDDTATALWEIVRQATDGDHPDDGLRLAAVLAARETDSRAFFDRVAGDWPVLRRELFGEGFVQTAIAALLPANAVVADLGCGPGDVLAQVAPWVKKAIGVDREPAMLEAARRRLQGLGAVELREGALDDVPLAPGEVDAALLMLVLHHVDAPEAAVASAARGLKPGGRLVIVDMVEHDREEYRRSMGHRHTGFAPNRVAGWYRDAGLQGVRHLPLPLLPEATGPGLFVAVGVRP